MMCAPWYLTPVWKPIMAVNSIVCISCCCRFIWYLEPSVLTTFALLGVLACLIDFVVPALSGYLFSSAEWYESAPWLGHCTAFPEFSAVMMLQTCVSFCLTGLCCRSVSLKTSASDSSMPKRTWRMSRVPWSSWKRTNRKWWGKLKFIPKQLGPVEGFFHKLVSDGAMAVALSLFWAWVVFDCMRVWVLSDSCWGG